MDWKDISVVALPAACYVIKAFVQFYVDCYGRDLKRDIMSRRTHLMRPETYERFTISRCISPHDLPDYDENDPIYPV